MTLINSNDLLSKTLQRNTTGVSHHTPVTEGSGAFTSTGQGTKVGVGVIVGVGVNVDQGVGVGSRGTLDTGSTPVKTVSGSIT